MGVGTRGPSIWKLAVWTIASISALLLVVSSDSLKYVQRRMLLSAPASGLGAQPARVGSQEATQPLVGRVGGKLLQLPVPPSTSATYSTAFKRCRPQAKGAPALPALKRAGAWPGSDLSRGGNTTVVTTLHVDRLPLLEAHCAVWPHTIVASLYAPLSAAGRVVCLSEADGPEQLQMSGSSVLSWLGLGAGDCPHAGWSVERLKRRVRQVQKRAQKTGQCNLQVELWTEHASEEQGAAVGLLPQAALQNRALQSLKPQEAAEHHAVLLLDSDIVSVDIWQLVNWPSRWERAQRELSGGAALVLPAFQLTPAGVAAATKRGEAAEMAAMRAVLQVVTAEAGKFPLKDLYKAGSAGVYADHGFGSSQAASLPALWFEAGDMHGTDDDGYPVLPQPGFAPFTMMAQQHVPWADERLRGSYYQRAWQAMAVRASGMQHVVQPNVFAMQLPHDAGYGRGEAALRVFLQMEPVFRQLVEEVGRGEYVPVTAFGEQCALQKPGKQADAVDAADE